eukprot:CCRYP_010733-RA/>CCRYP_010733-RA protein AED:0.37 eAED:0.37 QI:0/-1/0/1/-1/1/1/0/397
MAQKAIEDMVTPVFNNPPDPDVAASPVVIEKWKVQYNELQSKKKAWKDAGPRAYQLLLVHCHPNMEQKLVALEKFANINAAQDPVGLLKVIRSIAHKHEEEKGDTMARVEHNIQLYLCYQKPNISNVDYFKTFKAIRAVVDVHGGRAEIHRGVFEEKMHEIKKENGQGPGDPGPDEIKEEALSNEYLGCLFVRNANDGRFKDIKRTLDNAHLFGNNDYPTSIEDGLRMMENHKPSHSSRAQNQWTTQVSSSGVTFTQPRQTNRTGRQRDVSKDICFNCNETGQHAKDCQKGAGDEGNEKTGTDFFNVDEEAAALKEDLRDVVIQEGTDFFNMIEGVGFLEIEKAARKTCNRNKAYLDTCCTNHTCFASKHLTDIHVTGVVLKQHCNTGTNTTAKACF